MDSHTWISSRNVWEGILFDFAGEIFKMTGKEMNLTACTSEEYKTKAVRPKFSKMRNNSSVQMRDWKERLREYLYLIY